ncbi:MAG: hypothetical protein EBR46_05450 [Betaproteobacteria bacterium]|nr:hypothetical protein [Betaproteobacteria bacterium]
MACWLLMTSACAVCRAWLTALISLRMICIRSPADRLPKSPAGGKAGVSIADGCVERVSSEKVGGVSPPVPKLLSGVATARSDVAAPAESGRGV